MNHDTDAQLSRRPQHTKRVVSQDSSGSAIVLDLDSGEYFTMDGVGADVWAHCDGKTQVSEIIDRIEAEWGASREVVEQDVVAFLDELQQAGLIEFA